MLTVFMCRNVTLRNLVRKHRIANPSTRSGCAASAGNVPTSLKKRRNFFRGTWEHPGMCYVAPAALGALAERRMAVVAGPRQVGKSTPAQSGAVGRSAFRY